MSNYNFENFPEGEWEDRGEILWNEKDWQLYLEKNEREIERFLKYYDQLLDRPGRVDQVAHLMGWDVEDLGGSDPEDNMVDDDDSEDDGMDPYTIHRHPVYVVTRGLLSFLQKGWGKFLTRHSILVDAADDWRLASAIHQGEMNALLGLQALDLGDYALTICHFKRGLNELNSILSVLQELPTVCQNDGEHFYNDARIRLFDLREIWLRVMSDCREEIKRRFNDDRKR